MHDAMHDAMHEDGQTEDQSETRKFVAISGASGLVGRALTASLEADGHEAIPMVRHGSQSPTRGASIPWSVERRRLDPADLDGFDAVVHLAGENIASGRWTADRKRRIEDSRVDGTRLLAEAMAAANRPPPVLVSASAIGYYGDRGDAWLAEDADPGEGFLAEVCVAWERAADPARDAGVRVVHPRFGMILTARGGALAKMLTPFRFGLGGVLGTGRQWVSWMHLDDVVAGLRRAIDDPALEGPVNFVGGPPVTNRELTKTLGKVLSRPTVFPVPSPVVRLAFGEMGQELLLASTRVDGGKLRASGFEPRFGTLEQALRAEV